MFVSKIEYLFLFLVILFYPVPEFHKIKMLSNSNLGNVLYTSKCLNIFNANYLIKLLLIRSGAYWPDHSADIDIEAVFNPSAVALTFIFPGFIPARTITRHIPCQLFFFGC